jgi:hypothetical protein
MSYRGRLCAFAQLTRMRVAALQLKLPCQMCCHAATVLFRWCTHPLRAQIVELACRFHKPYRGRVWDFAQPTGTRVAAQHPTLSSFLCFWREPPSTFQPHLSKARELESWPVLVVRLSPVQLLAAHTRRTEARPSSCASRGGGGRVRSDPEGCRGKGMNCFDDGHLRGAQLGGVHLKMPPIRSHDRTSRACAEGRVLQHCVCLLF